eukprot:g11248.t1
MAVEQELPAPNVPGAAAAPPDEKAQLYRGTPSIAISYEQVQLAHKRILPHVHRTPVLGCSSLGRIILHENAMQDGSTAAARGSAAPVPPVEYFFKCENMQKIGAFKIRGAVNAISLSEKNTIVTHSSGNHAQAVALACQLLGKKAIVVMPKDSPQVKVGGALFRIALGGSVSAVRDTYGAEVVFCEPNQPARESTCAAKIAEDPANREIIHPYDDPRVIVGQGTLAVELLEQAGSDLDAVVIAVGGGGLLAGCATAIRGYYTSNTSASTSSPRTKAIKIIAAEPRNANDCAKSFKARRRIDNEGPPKTIADSVKTNLGENTLPIILDEVDAVLEVSEENIKRAMRLTLERAKLVIEPGAAVAVAAAMSADFREKFPDCRKVGFGRQEPGSEQDISDFVRKQKRVKWDVFAKVDVNGGDAHPLFAYLKEKAPGLAARVRGARELGAALVNDLTEEKRWAQRDFLADCVAFSGSQFSEDPEQVWAFLEDSTKTAKSWRKKLCKVVELASAKAAELGVEGSSSEGAAEDIDQQMEDEVDVLPAAKKSSSSATNKAPTNKKRRAGVKDGATTGAAAQSDDVLDELIAREEARGANKRRKTGRSDKATLLPAADEDADADAASDDGDDGIDAKMNQGAKASKASASTAEEGKLSKKKRKKANPARAENSGARFFGEMADNGADEAEQQPDGGKSGKGKGRGKKHRSAVDDEFFSLSDMHKFAEEGEKAWERMQKNGDSDDEDGGDEDEVYRMFFSKDIGGEGDDIMFDDFFAPAKSGGAKSGEQVAPAAATERAAPAPAADAQAEKHATLRTTDDLRKAGLLPSGLLDEKLTDLDADDEEEEEDEDLVPENELEEEAASDEDVEVEEEAGEQDEDSEEDELIRMRRERKKADMQQQHIKNGDGEEPDVSDDDARGEASTEDEEGSSSKDQRSAEDSESSSCSWDKGEDGMDAGSAVPFSGFASDGDDCDLSDLDPEERQLELALRRVGRTPAYRAGGGLDDLPGTDEDTEEDGISEGSEDTSGGEDSNAGGSSAEVENEPGGAVGKKGKSKSLVNQDRRIQEMEDEVERLEQEALADKHWSLAGEVSGKQRERNSLLELHLDLPMTHFQSKRTLDAAIATGQQLDDDEPSDDEGNRPQAFDIEMITRQRIADNLFDDVIRVADTRPATAKNENGQDEEVLNFAKSRVGLADIYAQQYEEEVFGQASKNEEKMSKEKLLCKELFGKVMYKLDQLCNAHYTPKPVSLTTSGAKSNLASLAMEEAVPLAVSTATMAAPSEIKRADTIKAHTELDREELTAVRRRRKDQRKKKLEGQLTEGTKTVKDLAERQNALDTKNKIAKDKKNAKGVVKDKKKKLKNTELLQLAADKNEKGLSRKAEMKKWKGDGAGGSKKTGAGGKF